jgi:hypothetical protein
MMSDVILFHPLANIFPLLEGEAFAALVADIKANGLEDMIVLHPDGTILDGRNRYRACVAAGVDARFEMFRGDDPLGYVISKNLTRRHLNESQRGMVAANLATMRQGERTDVEPSANLQKVAQATAATRLNVSPRTVADSVKVKNDAAPELRRAVEQGKLSVSSAASATKLTPETQRKIAEAAEGGNINAARTVIKQETRNAREAELGAKQIVAPEGKFGVIVEDYEWDHETWSEAGKDRHAGNHYPTSRDAHTAAEIVERTKDRFACAADDCFLGMWSTIPHLAIAIDVLRLRGFTYKSHYIWGKDTSSPAIGAGQSMKSC